MYDTQSWPSAYKSSAYTIRCARVIQPHEARQHKPKQSRRPRAFKRMPISCAPTPQLHALSCPSSDHRFTSVQGHGTNRYPTKSLPVVPDRYITNRNMQEKTGGKYKQPTQHRTYPTTARMKPTFGLIPPWQANILPMLVAMRAQIGIV